MAWTLFLLDGPRQGWRWPLPVYTADANGGLCIGRSRADHWGLGGRRSPTSGAGYSALLATTINIYK